METNGSKFKAEFLSGASSDVLWNEVNNREAIGSWGFELEQALSLIAFSGAGSGVLTLVQCDDGSIDETREAFVIWRDKLQSQRVVFAFLWIPRHGIRAAVGKVLVGRATQETEETELNGAYRLVGNLGRVSICVNIRSTPNKYIDLCLSISSW